MFQLKTLLQLRAIAYQYGLLDITCDNIRSVNGNLKIIDASIAPPGLFGLWKTADFIKLRLPPPIRKAIRKSRLLNTVKGVKISLQVSVCAFFTFCFAENISS